MPSSRVTAFLASLLSDGNYFPDDFLWDCEQEVLDFDRLGAIRDMLPDVNPLFMSRIPFKVCIEDKSDQNDRFDIPRSLSYLRLASFMHCVALKMTRKL
jgi:hypothetical protein